MKEAGGRRQEAAVSSQQSAVSSQQLAVTGVRSYRSSGVAERDGGLPVCGL